MRVTVVKNANLVIKNGVGFGDIDMSSLPSSLRAMQWYDTYGIEEYIDPSTQLYSNKEIYSLETYDAVLALWEERKG